MKTRENELHRPNLHREFIYTKFKDSFFREVVPCGTELIHSCVVCGYKWKFAEFDFNYCPNCGARLKEVKHE